MALAATHDARALRRAGAEGPGQHCVYGVVSDGDLMEGVSYEAASLAGHLGLGNLIYLYDDNHITIDGPTELQLQRGRARARFEAQRWHVQADRRRGLRGPRARARRGARRGGAARR